MINNSHNKLLWQTMNDKLEQALSNLLMHGGEQFNEHQLIKILIDKPFRIFEKQALKKNLGLFQTHFILFHVLYKLRIRWIGERSRWLEISPLTIRIVPLNSMDTAVDPMEKAAKSQNTLPKEKKMTGVKSCNPGEIIESELIAADPLTDYYLNLNNLWQASEHSVNNLLNLFWQDYLHPAQKLSAFKMLGCSPRDNPVAIKKAYRKLAMKYHPDRGGDAYRFKKLQEAYSVVRPYLPAG